jgi:hypothetical protein
MNLQKRNEIGNLFGEIKKMVPEVEVPSVNSGQALGWTQSRLTNIELKSG